MLFIRRDKVMFLILIIKNILKQTCKKASTSKPAVCISLKCHFYFTYYFKIFLKNKDSTFIYYLSLFSVTSSKVIHGVKQIIWKQMQEMNNLHQYQTIALFLKRQLFRWFTVCMNLKLIILPFFGLFPLRELIALNNYYYVDILVVRTGTRNSCNM